MIYFDNAATSLVKPKETIEAVVEAMTTMGNAGRGLNTASVKSGMVIYDTRVALAKLFNAESENRIAFTMNSTESLNIAIKGTLNKGDHVITTVSEHNSVLRPLYEMIEKGVEVTYISVDKNGMIDLNDFEKNVKQNTKALICMHASNLTGNVFDIEKIGAIAKKYNLMLIVDASQTAGVFDIDVQKMNIDILCFTGHKSLLGPQGTGGIYVKTNVDVKVFKSGGSGVHTYSKVHPEQMPTHLEAGTLNSHGIAGLGASLKYLEKTGIENIRKKEYDLMMKFYNGVKDVESVKIYGDFSLKERAPIVSLNIGDWSSTKIGDYLYNEFDISVRAGSHCVPLLHEALGTKEQGQVRFSFSHFNTEEEIDKGIKAIKEIAE